MVEAIQRSCFPDEYKENYSNYDNTRTNNHNSVIGNVTLLNRLAEKNGLAPVYDGVISKEQPYRREVANAVMEYIEYVINNRI